MTTHTHPTDADATDTDATDADAAAGGSAAPDFLAATRGSYDTIAADYAAEHPDGLAGDPLGNALFTAFTELVRAQGGDAPVADVGSGPGYVTARLRDLGIPAFGVDLSPETVRRARAAHPGLEFRVGSMTDLDVADGSLAGVLALYSVIHVPNSQLPRVFAEFHRVLAPGGHVLLAFQASQEPVRHIHLAERYGHEINQDYWFRSPEAVAEALATAGLEPRARVRREAWDGENYARAFVLARKPPVPESGNANPLTR